MKDLIINFETKNFDRLANEFSKKHGIKRDDVEKHDEWQEFVEDQFNGWWN